MPYGEPDIIDEHVQLTERVRKLETMNVSRTLIPKRWKPYNPAADMAYCHMVRALGLDPKTPAQGPLPQRIPPEVDMAYLGNEWPPIDDLWQLWLRSGYGPRYWLGDLVPHGGAGFFAFFTGSTFPRLWQVIGPDVTTEDVAHPYFDETNPPGSAPAVYMDTYPGLGLWDGSGIAVPDGGFYIAARSLAITAATKRPAWTPPRRARCRPRLTARSSRASRTRTRSRSPTRAARQPAAPELLARLRGCPLLHAGHPQGRAAGSPAPSRPDALGCSAEFDDAPTMPILSPVSASALRSRLAIGIEALGLAGWYAGVAERAQADLQQPDRVGWQPLPLFPPWWGRLECRYDARFVTFRGRVRNNANSDGDAIAAYPNWLPIGPRVGSFLPAALEDGQPLMIQLDHSFRDESPDNFMKGTARTCASTGRTSPRSPRAATRRATRSSSTAAASGSTRGPSTARTASTPTCAPDGFAPRQPHRRPALGHRRIRRGPLAALRLHPDLRRPRRRRHLRRPAR